MATPFRARLNTLRSAWRWAWSGDLRAVGELQAQLRQLEAAAPEALPAPAEAWAVDRAGLGGDGRWAVLARLEGEGVTHPNVPARLAWHMAFLWAEERGAAGLALFWAAVRHAAARPLRVEGGAEVDRARPDALHDAQVRVARALADTFPHDASQAPPWPEAEAAWQADPARSEADQVFRAMLGILAAPDQALAARADVPGPTLQAAAPPQWPWALWLVLAHDAAGLEASLATEGGATNWPGIQGWNVPSTWAARIQGRVEDCAEALGKINAPRLQVRHKPMAVVPAWPDELGPAAAAGAIPFAVALGLPRSVAALGTRGVDPNAKDGAGATPLDHAVDEGRLVTAQALVEIGGRFSEQRKGSTANDHPWFRIFQEFSFESPAFEAQWRALERALWVAHGAEVDSWSSSERLDLALQAAEHPLARHTARRVMEKTWPKWPAAAVSFWRGSIDEKHDEKFVRSFATLIAHNPHWSQADRAAFLQDALDHAQVTAETLIDDFADAPELAGSEWASTSHRPVTALAFATIHAPRAVPGILARSTSAAIEEALMLVPTHIGYLEGGSTKAARHLGITHSWTKFWPIWAQANRSVDPKAAFEALAGHPLTRADRDTSYPIPRDGGTESLTALELAMSNPPLRASVAAMLEAGGPVAQVRPDALDRLRQRPRDLSLMLPCLAQAGLLDAPAHDTGATLLMQAVASGDRELFDGLLAAGASVDPAPTAEGRTLSALAAEAGPDWAAALAAARQARLEASLEAVPASPPRRPRF